MKYAFFFLALLPLLSSCASFKQGATLGDPLASRGIGYQPLDPLPVLNIANIDNSELTDEDKNAKFLRPLTDETMRLAIGELQGSEGIVFGPAKMGHKNQSYVVILDYMKYTTEQLGIRYRIRSEYNDGTNPIEILDDDEDPLQTSFADQDKDNLYKTGILPVYIGVGLRLTASIKVHSGSVDLGNLFALGLAAERKQITGTLVIQTLGLSGESISTVLPMPAEINTTTIQNAILALGSIKARLYNSDTKIRPRVLGFYNNLGGGAETVNKVITLLLLRKVQLSML